MYVEENEISDIKKRSKSIFETARKENGVNCKEVG
jgi:hypothetical protein